MNSNSEVIKCFLVVLHQIIQGHKSVMVTVCVAAQEEDTFVLWWAEHVGPILWLGYRQGHHPAVDYCLS